MLKIRLDRRGITKQAVYRLVVVEAKTKKNSKCLAVLGEYNPLVKPALLRVNRQLLNDWEAKGAQKTAAVHRLLTNGKTT